MSTAAPGKSEAATALLKAGSHVDVSDVSGDTALTMAAVRGDAKFVRVLLESRADPSHRNHSGQNAMDIARYLDRRDVIVLLEAHKQAHGLQ